MPLSKTTAHSASVRNPLRKEGFILAARGAFVVWLGALCLLQVSGLAAARRQSEGLVDLMVGVLFLGWGMAAAGIGLVRIFTFKSLRFMPRNLSDNVAMGEPGSEWPRPAYNASGLYQMLVGRKYVGISVPQTVIAKGLSAALSGLMFLIPPLRVPFESLIEVTAATLVGLLSFALGWFSIASGVTKESQIGWLHWITLALLVYMVMQWDRVGRSWRRTQPATATHPKRIAIMLGAAAAVPLLSLLLPSPAKSFDTTYVPIERLYPLTAALAVLVAGIGALIIRARVTQLAPPLDPSESRESWQETIHPQELFIHFQRQIMARKRTGTLPNRIYANGNLGLNQQGGANRGTFSGLILEETEPSWLSLNENPALDRLRFIASLVGELLVASAALLIYIAVLHYSESTIGSLLSDYVWYALLLALFGSKLSGFAHLFWSEVQFTSQMVCFQSEGTYSEARLVAGNSYADTFKSENTVVRSSMANTIVCGRTVTSTLALQGSGQLNVERYVVGVYPAPEMLNDITSELRTFLSQRQNVVGLGIGDGDPVVSIQQLNNAARSGAGNVPLPVPVLKPENRP
jgi:hypothetical protein